MERSQPRNVPGRATGSCEGDAEPEIREGCQCCLLRNADNGPIMDAVKLGCQKCAWRIDRKPRKTLIWDNSDSSVGRANVIAIDGQELIRARFIDQAGAIIGLQLPTERLNRLGKRKRTDSQLINQERQIDSGRRLHCLGKRFPGEL
jgi:hypothetical protein